MIEFTTRQALRVYTENRSEPRKSGYRSWRFNSRRTVPTAPAVPWALYLADSEGHYRWIGFDLDDHEGMLAAEVAADLQLLTGWLEDHDIPHLVCASGGGAGRHIWIRLSTRVWNGPVAEMANILAHRLRTLDHGMLCNAVSGVLRGPGSPHKNGTSRSEPLPAPEAGRTAEDSLEWMLEGTHGPRLVGELKRWALTLPIVRRVSTNTTKHGTTGTSRAARAAEPAPTATAAQIALVRAAEQRCPLPPTIRRLATQPLPAGADTSRPAFAILIALAHTGWTDDEVHAAAFTYPGLTHLITEHLGAGLRAPRRNSALYIDRQWANAQRKARECPPRYTWGDTPSTANITTVVTTAAAAMHTDELFHGMRGATRTATMYVLLDQMATAHRQIVDLSARRWALGCGKSRGDTHRIIVELMEAGWIIRTAESDGPHAATYTLGPKAVTAGQGSGTQSPQAARGGGKPGATISDFLTHLRTDVWTADELGIAGGLVHYELARRGPCTVGELAAATRLDGGSVVGLLEVMEMVGLAEHVHGRWCANTGDGFLAYAADILGVTGVLDARLLQYTIESRVWAWWCAEQDMRRKRGLKSVLIARYGRFPTVAGRLSWQAGMAVVRDGLHQLELELAS